MKTLIQKHLYDRETAKRKAKREKLQTILGRFNELPIEDYMNMLIAHFNDDLKITRKMGFKKKNNFKLTLFFFQASIIFNCGDYYIRLCVKSSSV